MKTGVHALPKFPRDTTDRNRTSPFAFTGNKFEFRMPGSQQSIADCNVMLNTAVAESLKQFADVLENAYDFETALHELVKSTVRDHKRIIFNGNGYDEKWIKEATEKRGLLNLRTTPDALPAVLNKKNVDLLTSHNVMSLAEIKSRYEITLENYCKTVNIEGLTMIDMARKEILPAIESYVKDLSETLVAKTAVLPTISAKYERTLIENFRSSLKKSTPPRQASNRRLSSTRQSPTRQNRLLLSATLSFKNGGTPHCRRRGGDAHRRKILAVPDVRQTFVRRIIQNRKQSILTA